MLNILFLDDDEVLLKQLHDFLSPRYNVFSATAIEEARAIKGNHDIDCYVVDIVLKRGTGFDFVKEIKETSSTPVIMLTDRHSEGSELYSFKLGADDYIIKPFSVPVIAERIAAKLREKEKNVLCFGGLLIDGARFSVSFNGKPILLTRTEFDILFLLASHEGVPFDKTTIYERLWKAPALESQHTVHVHLSSLRKKLKEATGIEFIQTGWKKGYCFRKDGDPGDHQ